jgi:hypothetical protein
MRLQLGLAVLLLGSVLAAPALADSADGSTSWGGGAVGLSAGYQNSLIKMGFGDTHVVGPVVGVEGELLFGKTLLIGPRIDVAIPLSDYVLTAPNTTYTLKSITKGGPSASMGLEAGYAVMPDLMLHAGFDWGFANFSHEFTCKPGSAACPAIPGAIHSSAPGIGFDGGVAFAPWGPKKPQLDLTASYMSYLINSTTCASCSRSDLNILVVFREPF